jgi:hypothetical protein
MWEKLFGWMRRQDIAMMPNRATWTPPCAAGRRKGAGSAKTPNIFDWVLPFFSMDLGKGSEGGILGFLDALRGEEGEPVL